MPHKPPASVLLPLLILSLAGSAYSQTIVSTVVGGGPNRMPAIQATLEDAQYEARDSSGNLYIADTIQHKIFKIDPAGRLTHIAGNGCTWGIASGLCPVGNGGPATSASFSGPRGLALDSTGGLFILDNNPPRIVRMDLATGIISSTDGTALDVNLGDAQFMTMGRDGKLLVSGWSSSHVFRLDLPLGHVSILAGTNTDGFNGDGGLATAASLNFPVGLAEDPAGNLYIADSQNHRIRRIDAATGRISTVAGDGTFGFSGDGGAATHAQLYGPDGVAVDAAGNLFIGDTANQRVRLVDAASGRISTVAGGGSVIPSGTVPAIQAMLGNVHQLLLAPSGLLIFVNDAAMDSLEPSSALLTRLAGTGAFSSPDGVLATRIGLPFNPGVGLAVDTMGAVYFTDPFGAKVRKMDAHTRRLSTVAGNGTHDSTGDGGPATSAGVNSPGSLTVDPSGNLFLTDTPPLSSYAIVRRIDASTRIIDTIAGGGISAPADGLDAKQVRLDGLGGLSSDASGNVYFALNGPGKIFRVDAATGLLRHLAGSGVRGESGNGVPATGSSLATLGVLAADPAGNVYFAETFTAAGATSFRIKRIDAATGILTTTANTFARGLVADAAGTVYFTDGTRIYTPGGFPGIPFAGTGVRGFSGDGGPPLSAQFDLASGLASGGASKIYVFDQGNGRIRRIGNAEANNPPTAQAGFDLAAECSSPAGGEFDLDGSASTDPDSAAGTTDGIYSYEWFENHASAPPTFLGFGSTLPVTLPLGDHDLDLIVTDNFEAGDTDSLLATTSFSGSGGGHVSATPNVLTTVKHQLVPIHITLSPDTCLPVTATLASITSSEPDDAKGGSDGHTVNDIQETAVGTADFDFLLRAELDIKGPGRTYHIVYNVLDSLGNPSVAEVSVFVPGKKAFTVQGTNPKVKPRPRD